MNRRIFVFICLLPTVFLTAVSTEAQQPAKVPRIGFYLDGPASAVSARIEGFRQGLRELGYIEGKNIMIEWRSAEGNPEVAVRLPPSLCVLKSIFSCPRGRREPVPSGKRLRRYLSSWGKTPTQWAAALFASLARPGGNITGLSALAPEMSGKQLELMKGIVPTLWRVAIIGNSTNPGDAQALRETVLAAGSFEIYLRYLDVLEPKEIGTVFRAAVKGRADAVLLLGNPILNSHRKEIADLAAKHRLPASYARPEYVEAGGLMYGTNYNDLFRRAAYYVDKILKGAKPADLPVEQPTKFELIINLKAAKQIGLTIPPNVLARADKVIR